MARQLQSTPQNQPSHIFEVMELEKANSSVESHYPIKVFYEGEHVEIKRK